MKPSLQAAVAIHWRPLVAIFLVLGLAEASHGQLRRGGIFRGYAPSSRSTQTRRAEPAIEAPARTPAPAFRADQEGKSKFAMIVALREYPQASKLPSLPGTERDALRLAAALRNGGYSEENIVLVYDDAELSAHRPTRKNILEQLDKILMRANSSSASIAVLATGHGVALGKTSYLCPRDATDEALSDEGKAAAELISIQDIAVKLSKNCGAAHKLLVIDACRDTGNARTENYVLNVADLEQPAEGVWLMSSCSNGQFSWMSERIRAGERHALFSHFIAEGLEGAADLLGDNDGRVGLFELYTYAFVKTRAAAQDIQKVQTPELFGLASPFNLANTGSFMARRKLTTSDPAWEGRRSALHIADDVVLDLRAADAGFRETVSGEKATQESIRDANRVLHQYLCHLLGNRIQASLEFDPDCKLAHVAQGLCYRTCGMYEEALTGFLKGGESLDLFVKAQPGMKKAYIAHDESGGMLQYRDGNPVPLIQEEAKREKAGTVPLFAHPNDEKPQAEVPRQAMVRITKIDGSWLFVSAVNDTPLAPGGWIAREEVHWFPEAIDLYTPSSPMRPWSSGSGASRLDYAANGLNSTAQALALPAVAIEQAAIPFDTMARRAAVGTQIRSALGPLGGFVPYLDYADLGAYYASLPAGWIRQAASYVRIPSNYVAVAGGYAQTAAGYAHLAQFWSGAANDYYDNHERAEKREKDTRQLTAAGDLERVKQKPISLGQSPWAMRRNKAPSADRRP